MKGASQGGNSYFPIVLDLKRRRILVVGGGKVAARKIGKLLEAQAKVTIVAPQLVPVLMELVQQEKVNWIEGRYKTGHLLNYDLVIAATDDQALNLQIVQETKARNILVNSVDGASNSDFLFPALIRRGDLLIAVSTSGKRPALARKIRQELEFIFGQEYAEIVNRNETF